MNDTWWVKHNQLDEQQRAVIDLPLTASHLIKGPPGSGKTNLLLLRGSQMVRSAKPNVLILVFTRTLREFVVTGSHHYAFGPDKIKTLNAWSYEFMRENGVTIPKEDNFEKQRAANLAIMSEVRRARNIAGAYDAIILDEAQDYLTGEMELFFALGKVVFAAADSRQHIYPNEMNGPADLEKYFQNIYPLKYHYRNGHKICQVADALAQPWQDFEPLMPTTNYDEKRYPSSIFVNQCGDLPAQVAKAVDAIETQIKAYPDEQIAVLCPRSVLKNVWEHISASRIGSLAILQSAEEGYVAFEAAKPLCVCSVHAAKGLEFRAVHLLDIENVGKSPLRRNICYTAITRAKTSLCIYHTKPLPGYVESAINAAQPPVAAAKLEQLFGGS